VAVRGANFAWQLLLDGLLGRVVPLEIMVPVGEVDVLFVENSGPLEWCSCRGRVSVHPLSDMHDWKLLTMLSLACRAMAQFGIEWNLATWLMFDFAAMTTRVVNTMGIFVRIENAVWCSLLPAIICAVRPLGWLRVHLLEVSHAFVYCRDTAVQKS
jgi:hypothetical protein